MAPHGYPVGTLFFQEAMILAPPSLREEDAIQNEGQPPSRPLQVRSPKSPTKTPRSFKVGEQVVLPAILQSPRQSPSSPVAEVASLILPMILQSRRHFSASRISNSESPVVEAGLASAVGSASPESSWFPLSLPTGPRRSIKKLKQRPGRPFLRVVVSDKTLAEFALLNRSQGGALHRSDGVTKQELDRVAACRSEIATHRRTVIRQEGAMQRARVRKRGQQRKQVVESEHEVPDEQEVESESDSCQVKSSMMVLSPSGKKIPSQGPGSPASVEAPEKSFTHKLLKNVPLKSSKESRMQSLGQARGRQAAKLQQFQIHEERCRKFEMLPIKEQRALKEAFYAVDEMQQVQQDDPQDEMKRDRAKSQHQIALDRCRTSIPEVPAEPVEYDKRLFHGLAKLGLTGSDGAEQKDVKMLCQQLVLGGDVDFHKFCFELVPKAREKGIKLNQEMLYTEFSYYDQDNSGTMDLDECFDMFKKVCRNMDTAGYNEVEQDFHELFDHLKVTDELCAEHVDFDGFQMLIARVREKCSIVRREHELSIISERGVDEDQAALYADELLPLHETFAKQDADMSGALDIDEVVAALFEHGLMPYTRNQRESIESLVHQAMIASAGPLSFTSFLLLIKQVRETSQSFESDHLNRYFKDCDKDKDGRLNFAEASIMFQKLGLCPQSREEQDEMKNMLLRVDVDNSGDLDFEEFQVLVQHITEKLRSATWFRQNNVAMQFGFTLEQLAELRDIFFKLDVYGCGEIGMQECRKLLTLLRLHMEPNELNKFFEIVDKSNRGWIDHLGFFEFVALIGHRMHDKRLAPANEPKRPSLKDPWEADGHEIKDRVGAAFGAAFA